MKKIAMTIAALTLASVLIAPGAFAAGCGRAALSSVRAPAAGFTDTDGDGVCDHLESGRGAGFTDADGDGVCDHLELGLALCRGNRWKAR